MAFKAIYFLVVLICGASGEFVLVFVVVVENEFYIFIKVLFYFVGILYGSIHSVVVVGGFPSVD